MSGDVHVRFCERLGGRVPGATRLLLFAPTREAADRARDFAARQLERRDLSLHPTKTRVVRSSSSVSFLGETLPQPTRSPHEIRHAQT
jgi:hypothetical protein